MTTLPLDSLGKLVGVILAVGVVCGCAAPEAPTDRFYRLSLTPAPVPSGTVVLPGGVLVERPVADGEIGNRAILYVSAGAPNVLQSFSYHYWAAPPANMIQDLLVQCLRAGAETDRVATPEQRVETRYTLFSEVQRLELLMGPARSVVLSIDIGLRDDERRQRVFARPFEAEAVPADGTVGAAAEALSRAFSTICGELITQISNR